MTCNCGDMTIGMIFMYYKVTLRRETIKATKLYYNKLYFFITCK